MRYFQKNETVLSEDTSTDPKDIRFKVLEEIRDINVLIKDGGGDTKDYSIGAHAIDLAQITEGRWFYIKANKDITVSINGGAALTLIEDKPTSSWMRFTSLSLTTTVVTRITVAVAGE